MTFDEIRSNIIGEGQCFRTPFGTFDMLYADWVASGRLYAPIEEAITQQFGPWVANTHSYSNYSGTMMTLAYQQARQIIKDHVNAKNSDALVLTGSGMTTAVLRLQQILGLCGGEPSSSARERPVVFISHLEHHSHHVSWMETMADVVIIPPGKDLHIDLSFLEKQLDAHHHRTHKIGAFTSGSNVTGIITPVHELARLMHAYQGYCFIDYAATAPYVKINMHPSDPLQALDAVYFSPHKFLGGPGSCGVLVFNKKLYSGKSTTPGGGNVIWTNPWGGYGFTENIEAKEDGGTPGFLQAIRAALAIKLKEKIGYKAIEHREEVLLQRAFERMNAIEGVQIIGEQKSKRIGVVAFNIEGMHYNAVVRVLNDRFGIQIRGGWACASTYCHYLFDVSEAESRLLSDRIDSKNLTEKPGWARMSLHPTMSDEQLEYALDALAYIAQNKETLKQDYVYDQKTNDFVLKKYPVEDISAKVVSLFTL